MRADHSAKKILVVDDSLNVMTTLVLVLRSAGFNAAGETSPAKAIQAAQAHAPDILLCDIHLGEKNGVELSLNIAKLLPRCRIILMSGDTAYTKIPADAHQHGHNFEVLPKPTAPEDLLAMLGPASSACNESSNTTVGESKCTERRSKERIRFNAPAMVAAGSIAASTKDITEGGVFFFTDAWFEYGSETDVVLMLPDEVGLPVSGMVCCHGRVVRSDAGGGQYGIAVEIDRLSQLQAV